CDEPRMVFTKFTLARLTLAAALVLASPLAAAPDVTPAVQPGGDIPAAFHSPRVPAIPRGGDIPKSFTAPRGEVQYIRREVTIPMRDGVKLYAVLIIPRGAGKLPIMLDRTPYSADKGTRRGTLGPLPHNSLFP